jgi:hypothetical protein
MRRFRFPVLFASAGLLVAGHAIAHDFPFEDPLLATVVGTPSQYQADLLGTRSEKSSKSQ